MHFDPLSSLFLLLIAWASQTYAASFSKPTQPHQLPRTPECNYPRLKDRLMRMINLDETLGFEVILHSECRGRFDSSNPNHIQLFDHLLTLSASRDVTPFLEIIMKEDSYSPLMFITWSNHLPLVSHSVLLVLKSHFRHPDSSVIFTVSLGYPSGSPERLLLNDWLVELQRPLLNWPFASNNPKTDKIEAPPSPNKSKSSKLSANQLSWSDFENVPGIHKSIESEIEETKEEQEEEKENLQEEQKISEPGPKLKFGHIYGWISRRRRPVARNSQDLFHLSGHVAKLHDTFLSFASPEFPLEKYAKSAKNPSKSFFELPNGALKQKVVHSANNNFAACRLLKGSKGYELQAMVKGDLMLVVLEQSRGGEYDYKYPANPYEEFINGSRDLQTISLEVKPTDIVLFLPRSLFSNQFHSISPHDIPGSFHHTELTSFHGTFVNFINYIHSKTHHKGLIAVGGFVHVNNKRT